MVNHDNKQFEILKKCRCFREIARGFHKSKICSRRFMLVQVTTIYDNVLYSIILLYFGVGMALWDEANGKTYVICGFSYNLR